MGVVCSIRYNNENVIQGWVLPDPAEQFHNPFLAMGRTKREESLRWSDLASGQPVGEGVMYVDPAGQFTFVLPMVKAIAIGAGIGGASYAAQTGFSDGGFDNWNDKHFLNSMLYGGISGGMSFGIGEMNLGQMGSSFMHAFGQGVLSELRGGDFHTGMAAGFFSSVTSASLLNGGGAFGSSMAGNLALSGLAGGLSSHAAGGNFWQGFGTGVTVAGLNHLMHHDPPGKKLLKTEQGTFLDLETGKFYDADGNFLHQLPASGRIDQDYTLEGILMPLAKAPSAVKAALHLSKNNNWLRFKRSWNAEKQKPYYGIQWGAHPKHAQHIKPQWLQDFNKWLRGLGGGHRDIWPTK